MVIEKCLRKYSDSYYEDMFGEAGANVIDSFNQASRFLSDFALSEESYKDECMPIMNKVFKFFQVGSFDIKSSPANILFQYGFNMSLQISSPMFTEEAYLLMQNIFKVCGDKYFFIVEDRLEDAAFQLKIPVTTSWKQLLSGGFISAVLFNMPYNSYRIFGDSGSWGKWCDYESSWSDYEIFGSNLDIPEIREYNLQMALPVDDYLYMKSNIGFPKDIQVRCDTILSNGIAVGEGADAKSYSKEMTLYLK